MTINEEKLNIIGMNNLRLSTTFPMTLANVFLVPELTMNV